MGFEEKHSLDDKLFWSAKFHSWNERTDDLYYVITIYKKSDDNFEAINRFGVVTYHHGDVLIESEELFERLKSLALNKTSNISSGILWKGIGQEDIDKI